MNDTFNAIYCISLARAPERRAHADTELSRIGLRATLVPAVDGQEYSYDDAEREGIISPAFGRRFSTGVVACAASHVRLWKRIASEGRGFTLILEDDCWFHPCLADASCFAIRWAAVPADADFVYLGCLSPLADAPLADAASGEESLLIAATPVNEHVARVTGTLYGTHAYALTTACAQRLLAEHVPLSAPVDCLPFDRLTMYALRRIADPARHGVPPEAVAPAFYANTSIWAGRCTIRVHGLISQAPLPSTLR